MSNGKRVAVTGMGVVSPYGVGVDILWDSIIVGKSAIGKITHFDATEYTTKIAGEVRNFNPDDYMNRKEAKRYDRFLQFSKAAAKCCLDGSGLVVTEEDAPHYGVAIGSGIGGMQIWEETHKILLEKGPSRVSPFFIPMMLGNMASGMAAMDYNFKGPNVCMVTACATAAHNIGTGLDYIREGKAKVMLVGGTDAAITPLAVAGFASMKALSSKNDEPEKASRPFDRNRDGFVMSEGGAVMLLEDMEHAKARGAIIYGELVGFGMSADAHHIVQPDPEGMGAARAMKAALEYAQLRPEQISYINTHGTSTPAGDIAETKAIKTVFGEHAYKMAISSTKSMHGHLLGAAGAIEGLITILALQKSLVPPTINLDEPDPECDLDYVPHKARELSMEYALSNSFGFGGTNAVLVFRKYSEG